MNPRKPLFPHQVIGVDRLSSKVEPELGRTSPGCFALFDEQGCGKSKQVIDAATVLFQRDEIDEVIVIVPGPNVRSVWYDPELGQLADHLWDDVPAEVFEYHGKIRTWRKGAANGERKLTWVITNYEYIRCNIIKLEQLLNRAGPRTLLVLDESSAVSNSRAKQSKACAKLRRKCGWVWILNGTPGNPSHIFSQFFILDPKIIGCQSPFAFRSRYALMGGFQRKEIVGWLHGFKPSDADPKRCALHGCTFPERGPVHSFDGIGEIQTRTAPYILRRLKDTALDLPEKIPSVTMTVPLTPRTWTVYKEMRDDLIVWFDKNAAATASQAGVRALRLAQIAAGFVGGIINPEDLGIANILEDPFASDEVIPVPTPSSAPEEVLDERPVREVGREKLDLFHRWLNEQLEIDPALKLIVWCRFRPEVQRLLEELKQREGLVVNSLWGGMKKEERQATISSLDPRTAPEGPVVVVGTPQSGALGLNLTACHTVMYLTNGTSLRARLQSEDRVHRPGQVHKVSYFDVVATGPHGERTIDHTVINALRAHEELANWTSRAWLEALKNSL